MSSTIFTFVIGGASVYFFYDYSFLIAVGLLTWFLSRLFGYNIKRLFDGVNHSNVEKLSNVTLELKINISSILNHPSVSALFEKLKDNKEFKFKDKSEWIKTLIENYKKAYKNDKGDHVHKGVRYVWETVKFNIKNNVLWKNGQVDFNDSVEHQLFIPYEYNEQEGGEQGIWQNIYEGIWVRVLIVNGLIKVQIGNFNKETTPHFYKEDGLAVYKSWETITTFPLMYVSQSLPVNYLNLSMYATEGYKGLLSGDKTDWTQDWKDLNREMDDYNYLRVAFANDEPVEMRFNKVFPVFNKKAEEEMAKEDFVNPFKRDDDGWVPDSLRDDSVRYQNEYLVVFIADYKDFKDKKERYSLTDYYEEHP